MSSTPIVKAPSEEGTPNKSTDQSDSLIVTRNGSADGEDLAGLRPEICITAAEFHDLVDWGKNALVQANEPKIVFSRGGQLVAVSIPLDEPPFLSAYNRHSLLDRMSRTARWVKHVGADKRTPITPPLRVAEAILATPVDKRLPIINRIVTAPVFGRDGSLADSPGYHAASKSFLASHAKLGSFKPVDRRADQSDINWARSALEELVQDFPFDSDASKANAMGLLFLPFLREMIDGPTPLHAIEAPVQGTGKSLLASALLYPALGDVAQTPAPRDVQEWDKTLTAMLSAGLGAVVFDNVRGTLGNQALEMVLTTDTYTARILGVGRMGRWPVRNVWVATLNNASLTKDMVRRSVRIRLDADMEHPYLRDDFAHSNLMGWAAGHRISLVQAALTICQAWVNSDMPGPVDVVLLGKYEEWTRVIGGVLEMAGYSDFLGNHVDMREDADDVSTEWAIWLRVWQETFGDRLVPVKDLVTYLAMSPPDSEFKANLPSDIQYLDKIGYALRQHKNSIYDGRKLICEGKGSNPRQWRVIDKA